MGNNVVVKSKIIDGRIVCGSCDYSEALHECLVVQEEVRASEQGRMVIAKCPKRSAPLHFPARVDNVGFDQDK